MTNKLLMPSEHYHTNKIVKRLGNSLGIIFNDDEKDIFKIEEGTLVNLTINCATKSAKPAKQKRGKQ